MMRLSAAVFVVCGGVVCLAGVAHGQGEFRYEPPGQLVPNSGQGRADDRVYVPGMRYPLADAPSYPNSQVWGRGGNEGGGGGQCDAANYSYPWHDNYCESRQWDMPLCPAGNGHQGQDIRPATCENRRWWAVAAEDGTITAIGGYSVSLTSANGTRHRYLHMDPNQLAVRQGQQVRRGDRMGLVSNAFNGTPTTIHLHYDLRQNVNGSNMYVPTYMSLIRSYEELIGGAGMPPAPCAELPPGGGILDDAGPCFERFGPAATWRTANQGTGGSLIWTYAWVNATPGNWARWQLHFTQAGRYQVFKHKVAGFTPSEATIFNVRASGAEQATRVNFSAAGEWILIGEYDFAAGGNQWVAIEDNTGENRDLERQIVVDSIRILPVREPEPEPMPEPAPVPEPEPDQAPDPTPEGQPSPMPEPVPPEPEPAPQPEPMPEGPAPEGPAPEGPSPVGEPEPDTRPEAGPMPEPVPEGAPGGPVSAPGVRQSDPESESRFVGSCGVAPATARESGLPAPGWWALSLLALGLRRRRH